MLMNKVTVVWLMSVLMLAMAVLASPAGAQTGDLTVDTQHAVIETATSATNWPAVAGCFAAAVAVIGGALGIARVASHALDNIARQPEAAATMFLAWLLPAAMIEGAMLFAIVLCLILGQG